LLLFQTLFRFRETWALERDPGGVDKPERAAYWQHALRPPCSSSSSSRTGSSSSSEPIDETDWGRLELNRGVCRFRARTCSGQTRTVRPPPPPPPPRPCPSAPPSLPPFSPARQR
jgi:hypothetical protein